MNPREINSIKLVFFIFCFGFILVIGKALKVQLIDSKRLVEMSKNQYFRESKVYPRRGNIYDRNNNPLAINIQTYSIFTIPKNIGNKLRTYKRLSKILPSYSLKYIRQKLIKGKNLLGLRGK